MLSNWEKQAVERLEKAQYDELLKLCEQTINAEEEGSLPYWYLGLAYLLKQEPEEAQAIWLSGWFEAPGEETSDERTEILVRVLEKEAKRQFTKGAFLTSAEIKENIQEIQPENLNNTLSLIKDLIKNKTFSIEYLEQWEFWQRLEANRNQAIDATLLGDILVYIFAHFPVENKAGLMNIAFQAVEDKTTFLKSVVVAAGKVAYKQSKYKSAIEILQLSEKLQPDFLPTYQYLSQIQTDAGKHKPAIDAAEKLIKNSTTPLETTDANFFLLRALLSSGNWKDIPQVAKQYKKTLEAVCDYYSSQEISNDQYIDDDTVTLPLAAFYLSQVEDKPRQNRLLQNQVINIFQKIFLANQDKHLSFPSRQPIPNKRLRVGYMGHTLRFHSVGWLSRWLIKNHTKEDFQTTVYLVNRRPDALTEGLIAQVDDFKLLDQNTYESAEQIAKDEIDILVDLDSATLTETCRILSLKPAPIQITWLGWDASSLPAVDYYIADPYVLPENAQDYYQEIIWRLPHSYVAVKGFEAGIPTLKREDLDIPTDAVIYFSAQSATKRHPDTVRLQMQILKQVPNSYFLIKGLGDQEIIREFFTEIANGEGVDPNRLRFLSRDANELAHRANLTIADVVLDTYPYNGATTTLETLWMGVPLVTKVGEQYVARNSYTFLKNVGVEEGIAWTDEEYVEWGVKLGTDENLRRDVHWKLLQSRKTAPLWDVEQFVTDMETAYQQMWAKYVEQVKTYPVAEEATSPEEKQTKPKLRLLHNLPRCGGTIISKCLATMENNLLLSEIHPRGMDMFNPLQQAHDWFDLLTTKDFNELATSKPVSFVDAISRIHQRSEENNCNLIIRDWAHLDFFGVPWTNNLSYRLDLAETLKTHFDNIQAAIVRHPVDQWLSLCRLELLQGKLSLENFLQGYLEFAKIATEIGFIRYEDFTHDPDTQLQALCEKLETPFDPNYKEKWQTYKKITGETASQGEITPQPRRHIEPEVLETIEKNEFYQEAITLLGYSEVNSK
ncbi:MAG: O-linked N-acetylglucosamine transferase, SPINDLY family protein [Cyanobacteria bacterium]|nr:O-linked N-acetylglucosamine transferase, SPINDLY family protein [Cyanobacteria bacterium GSL.Bin1]